MSVLSRLKHRAYETVFDPKVQPLIADGEVFTAIMDAMPTGPMVRVKPNQDNNGLNVARNFVKTLYTLRTGRFGIKNKSPVHAFELWHADGETQFRFLPEHDGIRARFEDQVSDSYDGAKISPDAEMFPVVNEGDFIAGTQMTLAEPFWKPIKRPDGLDGIDEDPYGKLISEMEVGQEKTSSGTIINTDDVRVVVQVVFQPCKRSWSTGGLSKYVGLSVDCDRKGNEMKDGRLKGQIDPEIVDASRKRKKAAKQIAKQRGEPAFRGQIRVLAISPFAEIAQHRVRQVSEILETSYYNTYTEQRLVARPLRGEALRRLIIRTVSRQLGHELSHGLPVWNKLGSSKMLLTVPEVAGLTHLPDDDVQGSSIDWSLETTSPGVPPDLQSFEPPNKEGGTAH
jgi:hypothetical protein